MRLVIALCIGLCSFMFTSSAALGELLVYEGFDYPVGALAGQGGGLGFAEGSTWGGGEVVAGSLAYTDASSNALPTSGNHVLVNAETGSQSIYRALKTSFGTDATYGAGSYWLSFISQRLSPHPTLDENSIRSHGLQLHRGTGDERLAVGKVTTASPVSTNLSIYSDGSPALVAETTTPIHDLSMILVQVQIADSTDGNLSDSASMWIDPLLEGALGTPDAQLTPGAANNFDYIFDNLRLWAGGTNADGPYASWILDEIRIGTQMQDVLSGIPVPGDTTGNGVVDINDLNPILQNYRTEQTDRTAGDLVDNDFVDFADFRQWKTAFLEAGGSLEGINLDFLTAVPEPSSLMLVGAAVLGLALVSKRHRS